MEKYNSSLLASSGMLRAKEMLSVSETNEVEFTAMAVVENKAAVGSQWEILQRKITRVRNRLGVAYLQRPALNIFAPF